MPMFKILFSHLLFREVSQGHSHKQPAWISNTNIETPTKAKGVQILWFSSHCTLYLKYLFLPCPCPLDLGNCYSSFKIYRASPSQKVLQDPFFPAWLHPLSERFIPTNLFVCIFFPISQLSVPCQWNVRKKRLAFTQWLLQKDCHTSVKSIIPETQCQAQNIFWVVEYVERVLARAGTWILLLAPPLTIPEKLSP